MTHLHWFCFRHGAMGVQKKWDWFRLVLKRLSRYAPKGISFWAFVILNPTVSINWTATKMPPSPLFCCLTLWVRWRQTVAFATVVPFKNLKKPACMVFQLELAERAVYQRVGERCNSVRIRCASQCTSASFPLNLKDKIPNFWAELLAPASRQA